MTAPVDDNADDSADDNAAGGTVGIDPVLWARSELRPMLLTHNIGLIYRFVTDQGGLSQRQISRLTGQSQSQVCEIVAGRQVISYDVLVRVAAGLSIPVERMGLSWWGPDGVWYGPEGTYAGRVTVANALEGVSADMLRRHLIAYGGIALVGGPVARLGELLAELPGGAPDAIPLPSQLSGADVAMVRDLTRRLGVSDTHYVDPEVSSAAAARATRLLDVPGPEPVRRALQVAVAELHSEAGWSAFDAGLYRRALYHYARTLELATAVEDPYLQALALRYAGLASVEHGHPNDGLKMLQFAQVKARDIPSDERRAVVVGVSGRGAAEACALQESATALAALGNLEAAVSHLANGRDLWTPAHTDPFGDMDRPAAVLELARGRVDIAEALAAASLRRWEGGRQLSRTLTGIVQATVHVTAGEPSGLSLAHTVITAVCRLSSVRVRHRLVPLADALAARPGSDAQELARLARHVAASRA